MGESCTWGWLFHEALADKETLESGSLQLADGGGIGYSTLAHLDGFFWQKRGETE